MRNYIIGPLHSQNGIQRDGTEYASKSYIDGQWVRFYENSPKKMNGCVATSLGDQNIVRSLYVVPQSHGINLYMGRAPVNSGVPQQAGNVQYIAIDIHGLASAPVDRTPVTAFTPNAQYVWNFDAGTFTVADEPTKLIFANPVINDVSSTELGSIYVGPINNVAIPPNPPTPATTPLEPIYNVNNELVQGCCILFCAPVLVAGDQNGNITWSPTNGKLIPAGGAGGWDNGPNGDVLSVANTKIVKMANTRGGGSPTILLWSLNSLSRATLQQVPTGTSGVTKASFVNTVVQDNVSIMSANSVVNYEQQFFWIGTDQFYVYNGIVQTLPNNMNNDWFFLRVNLDQRSKLFGVAVPRYKEIWWFYARDNATENNACIIYNLELNVWYDNTIDPTQPFNIYPFTRAAGVSATGNYPYPIYSDNTLVSDPINPANQTYPIWTHEKGLDRVISNQAFAINSYFTTHYIDLWSQDGTNTNLLINWRVAVDFLQEKGMTMQVNTKMYPKSANVNTGPFPFDDSTEYIDISSQGGMCSFEFGSNVVGGTYQMGKPLYFYGKGDVLK